MINTLIFAALAIALYLFLKYLDLKVIKKALGITLVLELFYIIGYFLFHWPFPTALQMIQIIIVVFLGVALGVVFSKLWPLPPKKGFERILRTFLIVTPALGLGIGLQLLLQGPQATQGIFYIFGLASWLGSGHFIRKE
ncbi:MAG: hypothetical protein AB7V16_01620 [Vulcanibacillus sp.]